MGDRANILFKQNESGRIFLYGHSSGHSFPKQLQDALSFGKGRWNDEPYLTRIIVTRITAEYADSETGFGLSTYPTDNGHSVLQVDCESQTVQVLSADGWRKGAWEPRVEGEWSFKDFCTLEIDEDESAEDLAAQHRKAVAT